MISSKASNWVDRGEPPEPTLARILAYYLHMDQGAHALGEYISTIRGMAEADATEIHIAQYLATLEQKHAVADHSPRERRSVAIALWHIVKAAEVRDRAMRLLDAHAEKADKNKPRLSTWLAERILDKDAGSDG
jgi:hypothetical protein